MKFNLKKTALVLAVAAAASGAQATALMSGVITPNVDVVAGSFGGTLLDSAITVISNASYSGIARTAVYDTGTGLDFYYQFTNDDTSTHGVERFTGSDFTALNVGIVNVYQTGAAFDIFVTGTEESDYADRTTAGVIGFSFVPNSLSPINPGLTSFTQIIRTDAREYTAGNFGLLNGMGDNAQGFGVAAPVPELESYAMLLAGLGMVGTIIRRRKSKQG
ncbi:hypothetical protein AZ34_13400 [Hylemonella gracilis str. Niagara R]|uniref:PEP-CTERM protein-sorting domain-containing protein n=1 Tax=Hylemonella gracilis str. Niagara R TaxID=1458275 RepID=A0A016XNY4_9BURK|nr:hypothetical protein [Hylemonella gracilis]EYC52928.1 hypothetical protein AZ34_13400 [Hylemonella gracilis str. Niagara R]